LDSDERIRRRLHFAGLFVEVDYFELLTCFNSIRCISICT
jgi:hypothetical protein